MNYPLISEYLEAIKAAEENFEQLKHLRPVLDEAGVPVMTGGNFAVVFKMKDVQTGKLHAVKCFLKEQEGRADAYRMIAEELVYVSSTFLTPIKYLDKELFVDSKNSDESEFPVLLMDWVEGMTLDIYLREHIDDQYELSLLAYQFSRLAMWLMPQPFAHGDLKPDNILVKDDGTLVLVDFDGMYVPAMIGQKARELGSPDFRHPSRTENDFDEHIDDFSLASILLSLKAISLQPSLLEEYGASDRLLFSEKDYRNLPESQVMDALKLLMQDAELASLYSLYILALSQNNLSQVSFRLFNLSKPDKSQYEDENLSTKVTDEDIANAWTDEYGVKYSKDRKRLLKVPNNIQKDYTIRIGTKVICDKAFYICKGWKSFSVSIPKGVEIIGKKAFKRCNGLDGIVIPSTVKTIEDRAFESCQYLKSVQLSYGLKSISEGAFADCIRLNSIIIPNSVISIGSWAFSYCKSLSKFTIPNSVIEIGDFAFKGCRELISISIPNGVKCIGNSAFHGCEELSSVTMPESLIYIGNDAFSDCSKLSQIELPRCLKKIGASAFRFSGLERICIPQNVDEIGRNPFEYCTSLIEICVHKDNPFYDSRDNCHSIVEKKSGKLISACINSRIPHGIKAIGESAFSGSHISSIVIPSSVREIEDNAFSETSISSIILPEGVTTLGSSVFDYCTELTSISIPNSLNTISKLNYFEGKDEKGFTFGDYFGYFIGRYFYKCGALKAIKIPNGSVKKFEQMFPIENDLLVEWDEEEILSTEVTDEDLANAWTDEYGAKYSKDGKRLLSFPLNFNITDYSVKEGTEIIGNQAFLNNFLLFKITFPGTITHIGWRILWGCNNITKISLPSSTVYIDPDAFWGCNQLHQIIIPVGSKTKFETLIPNFKDLLVEQECGWSVKDTRPFSPEEIALVKRAEVVASQYGNSVCFFMQAGGQTYIPLCESSSLSVGDTFDLTTAKVIILCREGKDDICRVLE